MTPTRTGYLVLYAFLVAGCAVPAAAESPPECATSQEIAAETEARLDAILIILQGDEVARALLPEAIPTPSPVPVVGERADE